MLIDLKNNFEVKKNNNNNVLGDYNTWLNEINDSHVIRGRRENWKHFVITYLPYI